MTLKFGTDGVRGAANTELTPELVLGLGRAAARVLGGPVFLIGRDTRRSGPMLHAALAAGLQSEGVDVVDLGVVPTPAVAFLSADRAVAAAMISASHNPFADNGVKLFAAGGRKLPDATEAALEAELERVLGGAGDRRFGAALGGVARLEEVGDPVLAGTTRPTYTGHVLSALEGRRLDGIRVALDCANGAASAFAPEVFRSLGAHVVVIHDEPDGVNINDGCGSTYPGDLQDLMRRTGAHLGLAFDGDADRVLAVDEAGELVDGDQIMAICAEDLNERGELIGSTVVVTVMTNLGFRLSMRSRGIRVVETQVGDRYVLEALEEGGWSLGGEQSGHVIFRRRATTGDGLLTGLVLADVMQRQGRPLSALGRIMERLPQVLRNVRVADRDGLDRAEGLWDEVAVVASELGDTGRVLLRPSGTEPVVRVMAEAPTAAQAEAVVDRLSAAVVHALGPAA